MENVFIYLLKCPISGAPRYVGKTTNPSKRLSQHLNRVHKRGTRLEGWLSSLRRDGLRPVLEILADVPAQEWPAWESAYIQFFIESGCLLVNATLGGEGGGPPKGYKHTDEARAAMRRPRNRRSASPETVERMKIAQAKRRADEAAFIELGVV